MRIPRVIVSCLVGAMLIPVAASAQTLSLTLAAKAQLATLAAQLVQIMTELSQAAAQGPTYTNSAAFQPVATSIATRLAQVQASLVTILSSGVATTPTPTVPTGSCPTFSRALSFGMQGTDILLMQQFLARNSAAHFAGSVSGVFDSETLAAVQRFQAAYGVVSFGTPDTTGYGRVGPSTAAAIGRVCAGLATPVTPTPIPLPLPLPTPTPTYSPSSGRFEISQSGLPQRSISVRVSGYPNASCTGTTFSLDFGDGQQQTVIFPSGCSTQSQSFTHTYSTNGSYTVTLRSGTFVYAESVSVQPSNYSLTMSAAAGSSSYGVDLTMTFNPGTRCDTTNYTLKWGDNTEQSVSFSGSSCSTRTKTISHTYPTSGQYTIRADDSNGSSASVTFNATAILAAGAGDPFLVLNIPANGANNSTTITDEAPSHLPLTANSGAKLDQGDRVLGSAAIRLPGSGYVSTPAHPALNLGSQAFTVDLWFEAESFPAANQQASIIQQADSGANDASLGGAGLVLYGSKLYYVGKIGTQVYHPFYNNSLHTGDLTAGVWYHAALVRSGNTIKLYLNGKSQGSLTVSGSANESTAGFSIGRYGDYGGNYFKGWVDEVHIAKGNARWTADFDPLDYYGLGDGSLVSVTAAATAARTATITVTREVGAICVAGDYDLDFGDGNVSTVSFDATCATQTATVAHTYAQAGTYTISVANSYTGDTTVVTVAAAAATTPYYPPANYYHEGSGGGQ